MGDLRSLAKANMPEGGWPKALASAEKGWKREQRKCN